MICTIEEAGKLFIPASYMQELRWHEGDNIEIFLKKSELTLRKTTPCCVFCSAAVNLVKYGKFFICRFCINNLHNAKDGDFLFSVTRD